MTSSDGRSTTDDLTAEQIGRIIANHERGAQLCSVHLYRQLLEFMEREAHLREALQYIRDRHWAATTPAPEKWINEFVDVAKAALAQAESTATAQDGQKEDE